MATALNATTVTAFKPRDSRYEVADSVCPGLYLIVQPTGAKSWAVRYRRPDGTPAKLTLGKFPTVELPAARDLARAALADVTTGKAPVKPREATANELVSVVWEEFKARHFPNIKESSAERFKRNFEKHILPDWKDRQITAITKRDTLGAIDDAAKRGPHAANSTVTVLSLFFNWCLGRDIIEVSPMAGVKKPTAETSRERTLTDDELAAIWNAKDQVNPVFSALVKILILTGARRNEVAEMEWSELDFENRLWTIPAARTKNGNEHRVYLSDAALAVLEDLPRIEESKWVFTTDGATHVSGFSKFKAALDKAAKVSEWRLHDTRRTAASGMARLGVAITTVEKALNHSSGSFAGIVSVYQRHTFAEETKAAFIAWGDYVARVASGESNVIPLVAAE